MSKNTVHIGNTQIESPLKKPVFTKQVDAISFQARVGKGYEGHNISHIASTVIIASPYEQKPDLKTLQEQEVALLKEKLAQNTIINDEQQNMLFAALTESTYNRGIYAISQAANRALDGKKQGRDDLQVLLALSIISEDIKQALGPLVENLRMKASYAENLSMSSPATPLHAL